MNSGMFSLTVPDDAYALLISNGSVSRISRSLNTFMDGLEMDRDMLVRTLSAQEDGALPVMLEGRVWISSATGTGVERLVILRSPSKLELEEWLEVTNGGKPGMLVDGSGRIFAVTEAANRLFAGFGLESMGDFLDQISMTAFLSAAAKCLSGQGARDFSVLTRKGKSSRRSQVMSLRKTGLMDRLMVVSFSSPSMAMLTYEQDGLKFAQSLFSVIPVAAVRLTDKLAVSAVNSYAAETLPALTEEPGKSFIEMLAPDDRKRVASLHGKRTDHAAPSHFMAGMTTADGSVRQFEFTSVPMPDMESFMLLMVPVRHLEGSDGAQGPGQVLGELLRILSDPESGEGHTRMILEFLRVGTGARGAAYVSRSRRITVGEATLPAGEPQVMKSREPVWHEDRSGHSVSIPLRSKQDQAFVKVAGIPSRRTDNLTKLTLSLAPLLAEYIQSDHQLDTVISLMNSISSFMSLIQGRERDVQVILAEIGAIVGADYLAIHTVGTREPVLVQLAASGTSTEPGPLRIEIPSIASWAYTHTETCYVPDTAVDQRFSSIFPSSRSEMAIPLVERGKTMGTLTVGCTRRDAFGYPVGSFLGTLGTALSLWLFREGQGVKDEENGHPAEKSDRPPDMEDLLLSLSHNVRSPITTLRVSTDLLDSQRLGKLNDEQRSTLLSMNEALTELTEYSERMLNFMKIELGQDSIETTWARPSDVVSSMLPIMAEKGDLRQVTVSAELPSEPFTASFDRARLEQIMSNLVNNAIQYNRPGGSVKIEVRMDGTSHWVLEVFNTGEGISAEDLPNVFDRFYSGLASTGSAGLGIGLTVVRSFVQQMGGTISVRSREGSGTWFTARFPIS